MNNKKVLRFLVLWSFTFIMILFTSTSRSWAQTTTPSRDIDIARRMYEGDLGDAADQFLDVNGSSESPSMAANVPSWLRVAYASYINNNWDIYLMIPPYGSSTRLTYSSSIEIEPDVMAGGQRVAYVSNSSKDYEIYASDIDGSNLAQLTNKAKSDERPVWSLDGSRLAFMSNRAGNFDIYTMNADGSNLAQLTTYTGYDGWPTWSPDGSQIVFVSSRSGFYDLWMMNADGSNPHSLTYGANTISPAWSPVGDWIAYGADMNQDGFYELWFIHPDGTMPLQIINDGYKTDRWGPTWSRDGKWILTISTTWIEYHNRWFWTASYAKAHDLIDPSDHTLGDDRVLYASWASTDTLSPDPCVVQVAPEQAWDSFQIEWSAQDTGGSGTAWYDVQVRSNGSAPWQDILVSTALTTTFYKGPEYGSLEFRCRAADASGNWASWDNAPAASTSIDNIPPTSKVFAGEKLVRGTQANLSWYGTDLGFGISGYDLWKKDGQNGDWELWSHNDTQPSVEFSGQPGHTYYFRSQAIDQAGHLELWNPTPQAGLTLYANTLTVNVSDLRGQPVGLATLKISPTEVYSKSYPSINQTVFYLGDAVTHTLEASAPGFGFLPPTILSTTMDLTTSLVFPPVENGIQNGNFETGTLEHWGAKGSGASITAFTTHTGQYALQIAHPVITTTQVTQTLSIDSHAHLPTFSFLYQIPEPLVNGGFIVSLDGPESSVIVLLDVSAGGWQHTWLDLGDFVSQTITVSFQLSGTSGTVFIDDISAGDWNTPIVKSISPDFWILNQTPSVTISGENFNPSPQVLLNDIVLDSVTWVSPTRITAEIPPGIPPGAVSVMVVNSGGVASSSFGDVEIFAFNGFLPLVTRNIGNQKVSQYADWPTLGGDIGRTGYNPNEAGGSRYSLDWEYTLMTAGQIFPTSVSIVDGILLFPRQSGGSYLLALDARNGDELWSRNTPGSFVSDASIDHGRIYLQTSGSARVLYSLDLYTGKEYWRNSYYANQARNLAPLVLTDTVYLAWGDENRGLYAVQKTDGQYRWNDYLYGSGHAAWTPSYQNGNIYAWLNNVFFAFDLHSGQKLWEVYGDEGGTFSDVAPVMAENTALLTSCSGLYAVDLSNRSFRWSYPSCYKDTLPAVAGNTVYAFRDNILEERQLSDGVLLWSYTGDSIWKFAPVITTKYLYASSSAYTYVFDRKTHQIVWQVNRAGWLAVANGYLYIVEINNIPAFTILAYHSQEP